MKVLIPLVLQWLALSVYSAPTYSLSKDQLEQIKTNTLINYALLEAAEAKANSIYDQVEEDEPTNFPELEQVEKSQQNEAIPLVHKKSPPYFLTKRKADVRFLNRRIPVKNLDLCKNVVCTNISSSGQIAKTWKLAQQATCCNKNYIIRV